MYTFNNEKLFTSYLKEFLYNFNLPSIEVWKQGKKCYEGCFYIFKNGIFKALRTGDDLNINNNADFKSESDAYAYGDKLPNLTRTLKLENLVYDSYTHNYLGKYLRFYRDYNNINLMPLYNCFSNVAISNFTLKDISGNEIMKSDDNHTIYMVDVCPYNVYTIFINCPLVDMVAGYYSNGNLMNLKSLYNIIFPYSATQHTKANAEFNKPFLYDKLASISVKAEEWSSLTEENLKLLYKERSNLKLFIKVPKQNKSSLVILEGDYTDVINHHLEGLNYIMKKQVIGRPYKDYGGKYYDSEGEHPQFEPIHNALFNQSFDRSYLTRLQLANIDSQVNHPFSDRLIEYLIGNVIKPDDAIDNNISKVQKNLVNREKIALNKIEMDGVWNKAIRNVAYGIAEEKGLINTKYDILGYIDKDIEKVIQLEDE